MVNYIKVCEQLMHELSGAEDIMRLDFVCGARSAAVVFVDGVVDKELMDKHMLTPLKACTELFDNTAHFINNITSMADPIGIAENVEELAAIVADGDIALIVDGADSLLSFSAKKYNTRAIQEPPVANTLRGPREGFVEDIKINLTMLRRRLRTPKLALKMMKIGKYTATNIAIAHIDGVASPDVVDKIMRRLENISIDGIIDSSYLSNYLEDRKLSIFSQIGTSEKPDVITAKMLEGRVAIIVDGSPTVLTLPFLLFEHFQSPEDYYTDSFRASLTRVIRILSLLLAMVLPAAYVSLQEFQYQMFPLKLLIPIMNSIEGVPLTPVMEMLVLLIIFEILSEASVRMPKYVGMALSVVGAIVLGEAAIQAGLMTTPAILVVALSTIGIYCSPQEVNSVSILRLLLVAVAGVLGLFGLILACMALLCYLVSIKSYGTSYLAPFAPLVENDLKDGIIKSDVTNMHDRPRSIPTPNRTREGNEEE